jgi:integrase
MACAVYAVAALLEDLPHLGVFPAGREHVRGKPTTTFNGWPKCTDELRRKCDIAHFNLHDLRRTFASEMAGLGVSQVVVEKLINHVSGGALSPIAAIYNRYSYMEEQRAAVTAW